MANANMPAPNRYLRAVRSLAAMKELEEPLRPRTATTRKRTTATASRPPTTSVSCSLVWLPQAGCETSACSPTTAKRVRRTSRANR